MGLLDRAFLDAGFEVTPGCEIDPEMRAMYGALCWREPIADDIADLIPFLAKSELCFDGVIGGPPCQAHTKLRAIRDPKFPDLTQKVCLLLQVVRPRWFLLENVSPIVISGARGARLDAMHYGAPHQSRPRWFTFSENLTPPPPQYRGSVDHLMAYSIVAGRIYGPKRGAILQGYPAAADLDFPCRWLQKGLANAVHYGLGRSWASRILAAEEQAA